MERVCRRQFLQGSLSLAGLGVLSGCSLLPLQPREPASIPRIGWLSAGGATTNAASLRSFQQGLDELGYVEGQTIVIDGRWAEGKLDRLPELAAELARVPVAVIVAGGAAAIRAAKEASSTIPIVMTLSGDPVAAGFIESLAKPGGNVTGLTSISRELAGKRLELLKEVVPAAARVAFLWDPANPATPLALREADGAARALAIELQSFEVHGPNELDGAFRAAKAGHADALYVAGSGLFYSTLLAEIVALAAQHRLPATYSDRRWVEAGGLMAYAPDADADFRHAATYVDKILKGARPADLPVERPTKLDFAINLKTAQALGLTISQAVLQQATELIQ